MWLLFAGLAAICFGVRGIYYHRTSTKGLDRNLILFGVFLTGLLVCLAGMVLLKQQLSLAALTGLAMGVFSYAANACVFKGFAVGKASVVAVFTGLPSVVVVVLAYLIWGEALTYPQLAAYGLVVLGIVLVRYSNDLRPGHLQGAQWGLLAMLFFAFNDLAAKYSTLLGADMFPTLAWMFLTGALLFLASWLLDGNRQQAATRSEATAAALATADTELAAVPAVPASTSGTRLQPGQPARTLLTGMLIGLVHVVGMICLIWAFDLGITGLVSAVIALNIVLILLYSRFALKDKFKIVELSGITAAILGVILLRLLE